MKALSLFAAVLGLLALTRPSPLGGFAGQAAQEMPFLTSELVFPIEHWHNHASMVVEAPNGDLLVDWFHGSGERTADDVVVRGAQERSRHEPGRSGRAGPAGAHPRASRQ